MDVNSINIEDIVKQVLADMTGKAPAAAAAPASAPAAQGGIPKTATRWSWASILPITSPIR